MRRGWAAVVAATAVMATACTGQGGSGLSSAAVTGGDPDKVSGDITVLTNRTDQVSDGTLKKYAAQFNKVHPRVRVTFEGITDYEGETRIRMNTENYGDVLLIPDNLALGRYPAYFAPLGDATDLSAQFDFTEYATVGGQVYGLANIGIATGFVYNKAVWKQAGVTDWPTDPQQFIDDLKAIKARTGATPYYTNYKDAWPLQQWSDGIGGPSCDNTAKDALAATAEPWSPGQDLYAIDGLLYSAVHQRLTEADPTTTNWEKSKTLMGEGRIGAMFLGSWAVAQMQSAAKAAGHSPDDIGFMPFPSQRDGHYCTVVQPDYKYAVNVHSRHKDAARAWIDWYLTKSGSARAEQAISTVRGTPLPAALQPFEERGVRMVSQTQDRAATVSRIEKSAEIGLDTPDYRQKLVDIARGAAPGDQRGYFADLNRKWSDAQRTVVG
ncbi:ABC transporter substrate-binding protein [Kitasatospora paranensis]|uniref:ABC transporter substrate-binding protein n=1 Tax=Kitasatospora paranensis TaxID=258053 RepID=A0ABW2FMX7_9ACTN